MSKILGIRREDKNRWERRVPLVPKHILELKQNSGIQVLVQPSEIRVCPDEEYARAGARVTEDLSTADTIFAVKEIPVDLLEADKTYVFFSHTIKGQPYNMGMLRKLMSLKCNLIDYERIVNEENRRLIFFGTHAGYAGMIETLHAYGQKMLLGGINSPFSAVKQAFKYKDLEDAKHHIDKIGNEIKAVGLPEELCPLIVGFAGYGNVSSGAQEILNLLPVQSVTPEELLKARQNSNLDRHHIIKVVFKERDLVSSAKGQFDLQEYYDHPEHYQPVFEQYLPHLDILLNCIYWTDRYPRLVTKDYLQGNVNADGSALPRVIGDISCDIEGAIEITKEGTMPDSACFTYLPGGDRFVDSIAEKGVTVMAVDNLPCEFPLESSGHFSTVLRSYVEAIVSADFGRPTIDVSLPAPIKKALILHKGELTADYTYLRKHLEEPV